MERKKKWKRNRERKASGGMGKETRFEDRKFM